MAENKQSSLKAYQPMGISCGHSTLFTMEKTCLVKWPEILTIFLVVSAQSPFSWSSWTHWSSSQSQFSSSPCSEGNP